MIDAIQSRLRQAVAPRAIDQTALEKRRLAALFTIALFKLFNFFGGAWDIQWHVAIGRDSLWIPPHLLVVVAFVGGLAIALAWVIYESELARSGQRLTGAWRFGTLEAAPPFWGVLVAYVAALNGGGFDELWHRAFGIDATLWSPPHLFIMLSTMLVDLSLLTGMATSARRLGVPFARGSSLFWGVGLPGAFLFEAFNFQMSQAFVEGYKVQGAGLYGLLFPVLVGAFFPLALVLAVRVVRRFSVGLLMFGIAFVLQLVSVGVTAAGFAILQPVSVTTEFIRNNPDSTVAISTVFMSAVGLSGWVGFGQAWMLALSLPPLLLVALLDRIAWARPRMWIAAPIYSASLVITAFAWYKQLPVLRDYPIGASDLLLGIVLSAGAGLLTGLIGYRVARIVPDESGM
ncbi:MAG: hypothetical protein HZB53_21410 [Chloroflexi bacterium]|nr:hypothetical protein [Chloroflexota bacterium]